MFSLENRLIVLTGGLGRLGKVYREELERAGAEVVMLDISCGDGAIYCNVADPISVENAKDEILDRYGVPDGIVNNAGRDPGPNKDEFGVSPDCSIGSEWDDIMKVNVKGSFLIARAFGNLMEAERRGSIVNIASLYSLVSPRHELYGQLNKSLAYCASKSAVLNMTRYLATYWKYVRVNTLTPGGVINDQPTEFIRKYEANTPLGRMASPRDLCGPLIFLLADASRYMTGANLIVDGGWTAW